MKRLWFATALALGFHWLILNADFSLVIQKRRQDPPREPVVLTLLNETPKTATIAPAAQLPDPEPAVIEPDKATEPLPDPLPVPQPKSRPKAKPGLRKHPDPPPEDKTDPEPEPEKPTESTAPSVAGAKTPDTATSLPQSREVEIQAAKKLRESSTAGDTQSERQPPIREAVPLYDRNPPPPYPQQARKRGFQGRVVLNVLVDKDGRVAEIGLHESCGHSILDNVALETVKGWAFTPGRRGQDSVEMWIRVPMLFELK